MNSFVYRPQAEKEIVKLPGMVTVLETYAGAGAAQARAAAPRGLHAGQHYQDTIFGGVEADHRGPVGRVASFDPFAHIIEFGSKNNPPYAPLRRGVEATGLRVTDRRRRG